MSNDNATLTACRFILVLMLAICLLTGCDDYTQRTDSPFTWTSITVQLKNGVEFTFSEAKLERTRKVYYITPDGEEWRAFRIEDVAALNATMIPEATNAR